MFRFIILVVLCMLGILLGFVSPNIIKITRRSITEVYLFVMTNALMICMIWGSLVLLSYFVLYILRKRNNTLELCNYEVIEKFIYDDSEHILLLKETCLGQEYRVLCDDLEEYNALMVGDVIQRKLVMDAARWRIFTEAGAVMSPDRMIK